VTFAVERKGSLVQAGSDGQLTAQALGLTPSPRVVRADGTSSVTLRPSMRRFVCSRQCRTAAAVLVGQRRIAPRALCELCGTRPFPPCGSTHNLTASCLSPFDRWTSNLTAAAEPGSCWWRAQQPARRRLVPRALSTLTEDNPVALLAQRPPAGYVLREFSEAALTPPVLHPLLPHLFEICR
jgi:hypothetical protein